MYANKTFSIEVEDTSHYGTFTFSVIVNMIYSGEIKSFNNSTDNSTTEEQFNTTISEIQETQGPTVVVFTLQSTPFAKYSAQFKAAFLSEDSFDESIDPETVPDSGGFFYED